MLKNIKTDMKKTSKR